MDVNIPNTNPPNSHENIFQKKRPKYKVMGPVHMAIFWGFLVLLINTLILWGRGFDEHVVRDLEGVPALTPPALEAVADEASHIELACPKEAEVELGDLGRTSEQDDLAPGGGIPEALVERAGVSDAIEDQWEAAAGVDFCADDRLVARGPRGDEGLSRFVALSSRATCYKWKPFSATSIDSQ